MLDWLFDNGVGGIIVKALRSVIFWLDEFIYGLIPSVYNLFDKLCTARMLDGTVMRAIADRVGLLLGLIMFFYVIFNLIQTLLNPDTLTDKEKGIGNIAKKVIIVIVLLGISNFIFDAMYSVQKKVIQSDVISKLILPYTVENKENFGNFIVAKLMGSFYEIRPKEDFILEKDEDAQKYYECAGIYELLEYNILNYNDLELGHMCLNESLSAYSDTGDGEKSIFIIDFEHIISLVVGGFVLYFLFSYCLTVGVRMLQLMCLEIIAPMAIIGNLSLKKDNMFTKWWKLYISTYADVFIRIAVISFALFLISTIFSSNTNGEFIFWSSMGVEQNSGEALLFEIILILAILTFAKKAPDLLKDLFPSSASKLGFGITSPKKMFDSMLGGKQIESGLKRTAGLGIGAVIGGAGNFARSMFAKDKDGKPLDLNWKDRLAMAAGGMWNGAKAGFGAKDVTKSFGASNKAALDQSKRLTEWRTNGGVSGWTRWKTGMQQRFGLQVEADRLDLIKADLEEENSVYKAYDGYIDAAEKRAESQIEKGLFLHADGTMNENAKIALKQKNLAEIYRQQSANIKRSDFDIELTTEMFQSRVAKKFNINKNDFGNENDFVNAINKALADAQTAGTPYTFDMAKEEIDKEAYEAALEELAEKAATANSEYLNYMKKAKADYITAVAKGDVTDAVVTQNIDQAAGIIDANNKKINFSYDYEENGTEYKGSSSEMSGAQMMKNYKMMDSINARAKKKVSENNTKLAHDKTEGRAARADAKYNPKSGK